MIIFVVGKFGCSGMYTCGVKDLGLIVLHILGDGFLLGISFG